MSKLLDVLRITPFVFLTLVFIGVFTIVPLIVFIILSVELKLISILVLLVLSYIISYNAHKKTLVTR
jgi:hypothetical protein